MQGPLHCREQLSPFPRIPRAAAAVRSGSWSSSPQPTVGSHTRMVDGPRLAQLA
jgi:hypothetical protein